jgi:hypothetical protein
MEKTLERMIINNIKNRQAAFSSRSAAFTSNLRRIP